MIGLDLNTSAKLAVIWIINTRVLLRNRSCFQSVLFYFFILDFVRLRLFFYTSYFFEFFIRE